MLSRPFVTFLPGSIARFPDSAHASRAQGGHNLVMTEFVAVAQMHDQVYCGKISTVLVAILVRLKNLFHPQLKHFRHLKGQRQARIVLAGFNRVDRLAAYSETGSQLALRPLASGAK